MATKDYFEDYLKNYLEDKQAKNSRYSLRLMAKGLDLEPSMLSKILRKRYKLNKKLIESIGEKINLNPMQIQEYVERNDEIIEAKVFSDMSQKTLDQLSNWESAVILRSFDLNPEVNTNQLSKKLNCSVEKIEQVLAGLVENGLIKKDSNGQYRRLKEQYFIRNKDDQTRVNKKLTQEMILKAHESVEKNKPSERVHMNVVFSMNKKSYDNIQKKIVQLAMEASRTAVEDTGREDCVMVLNVNFFPVLDK